jgi:hypothetical protein
LYPAVNFKNKFPPNISILISHSVSFILVNAGCVDAV